MLLDKNKQFRLAGIRSRQSPSYPQTSWYPWKRWQNVTDCQCKWCGTLLACMHKQLSGSVCKGQDFHLFHLPGEDVSRTLAWEVIWPRLHTIFTLSIHIHQHRRAIHLPDWKTGSEESLTFTLCWIVLTWHLTCWLMRNIMAWRKSKVKDEWL